MKKTLKSITSLIAFTSLFLMANASAESMAEQIKKRSIEMKEVKALLNDPDQSTRLAAMDMMLKSSDTAMKEQAYSVGFNSADDAVRAIALRNKLNEISSLTLYFTLSETATEKNKEIYQKFGGSLTLLMNKYDEKTAKFTTYSSYSGSSSAGRSQSKPGNVSGLTVSFGTTNCSGTLLLNEQSELVGDVNCNGLMLKTKASII
ncbi:hypothetical protein [Colwellia sp. BRX8-9]|uniref:hypothetical protein n=1 Tax=Colwellia sp. BRX8-9 TaxID=2759831 RepID=UPI0015F51D53|nr:hypothetical protein [Colwellia sp. BRX8-9]MBA6349910.1 hypothetical protein [Colwellia sp. BRX8-9]